jgi:hypothetical protein
LTLPAHGPSLLEGAGAANDAYLELLCRAVYRARLERFQVDGAPKFKGLKVNILGFKTGIARLFLALFKGQARLMRSDILGGLALLGFFLLELANPLGKQGQFLLLKDERVL